MAGETEKKDAPVVRKTNSLLKWLGGIAAIPLIGLLGNLVIGSLKDYTTSVNVLQTRVQSLEDNSSSKEAIWQAISKNREDHVNTRRQLVDRFNAMAVKYEGAMFVFERNHQNGNYLSAGEGPPDEAVFKMFEEMLQEVQKAEETDKAEIERLKRQVDKMRKDSAERQKASTQQRQLSARWPRNCRDVARRTRSDS